MSLVNVKVSEGIGKSLEFNRASRLIPLVQLWRIQKFGIIHLFWALQSTCASALVPCVTDLLFLVCYMLPRAVDLRRPLLFQNCACI